jgi:hypothetical protein
LLGAIDGLQRRIKRVGDPQLGHGKVFVNRPANPKRQSPKHRTPKTPLTRINRSAPSHDASEKLPISGLGSLPCCCGNVNARVIRLDFAVLRCANCH